MLFLLLSISILKVYAGCYSKCSDGKWYIYRPVLSCPVLIQPCLYSALPCPALPLFNNNNNNYVLYASLFCLPWLYAAACPLFCPLILFYAPILYRYDLRGLASTSLKWSDEYYTYWLNACQGLEAGQIGSCSSSRGIVYIYIVLLEVYNIIYLIGSR